MTNRDLTQNKTAGERQVDSPPAPSEISAFDLSSFFLEQCVLEVRYAIALTLWDSAGVLWRSVQEKWPEFALVTAEPTKQFFTHKKTAALIGLQSARITSLDSERSVEELTTMAREFFKMTAQQLHISVFTRLGARLMYFKEFKNRKETSDAFRSLNLVRTPDSKKFEIEEAPVDQIYSLRWESAKKGTLVLLKADVRKVDFDPPFEQSQLFTPIHKETNGILLDVDYYTVAPVESGQVDMGEWLNHAQRVIARDTRFLFEG